MAKSFARRTISTPDGSSPSRGNLPTNENAQSLAATTTRKIERGGGWTWTECLAKRYRLLPTPSFFSCLHGSPFRETCRRRQALLLATAHANSNTSSNPLLSDTVPKPLTNAEALPRKAQSLNDDPGVVLGIISRDDSSAVTLAWPQQVL